VSHFSRLQLQFDPSEVLLFIRLSTGRQSGWMENEIKNWKLLRQRGLAKWGGV
jgi:hypothetical protein